MPVITEGRVPRKGEQWGTQGVQRWQQGRRRCGRVPLAEAGGLFTPGRGVEWVVTACDVSL